MNDKPKRRWPRFSLRKLLLLVTIASVGFGWLGLKLRQAQRQKEAVEGIVNSGGWIWYDDEVASNGRFLPGSKASRATWWRRVIARDFIANPVTLASTTLFKEPERQFDDASLSHVGGIPQIKHLSICSSLVTDTGLIHLQGLSQLESLDLSRTSVTDRGLANLRGLFQLNKLQLRDTQITDRGLIHLQSLENIEYLDMPRSAVSDAGLVNLQGMRQLKELDFDNTNITDAGLVHLQRLMQLKSLYLRNTHVTETGCRELQKALPNLQIYR